MRPVSLRAAIGAAFALAVCASPLHAGQVPQNVGYGLDKLIESRLALARGEPGPFGGYTSEAAQQYAEQAITDAATGRVMVDITLTGRVSMDDVRIEALRACPSLTVTAEDRAYRSTGILEGWVSVDEASALSKVKGVRAVFLALKPDLNSATAAEAATNVANAASAVTPNVGNGGTLVKLGTAFDQGVVQHRVDLINQYYNPSAPINIDGNGITVGAMSDSFATRVAPPTAATDVATFDLPGAAGHPLNTQPVIVLHELNSAGTDEGRGMIQIIHKMAPRARLGFATGSLGEVAFANDIKALAGVPGFTYPAGTQQGFKADVIVDDISYGGEPFYGETIIGNAIDDVTALGVSYYSSAGNNIGINAYESSLRIVPNGTGLTAAAGNTALTGTNIDLTGVPTALYAGGFHNFNPIPGQQDVAQLVNMPSSTATGNTEMQWDDPYDQHDLTLVQPPILTASGNIDGVVTTSVTYDNASTPALPAFTAGTAYVINVVAPNPSTFDAVVTIRDPSNNVILTQDTGTDEVVNFFPVVSGQYKIVITAFTGTSGAFNITVNTATGNTAGVTTDLNLLVFRADTGAFVSTSSLTANNLANNRPVELGKPLSPAGQTQVQFVIARANIPPANQVSPTRVRWSTRGNGAAGIGPAEYFSYNAVTTKGHASAKGCNGTAAYSVFRQSMPESFTSPGPATILFDKDANRLAVPEIREVPRVAAADAANTSSFGSDSTADPDTNPNFSGTSAAAPHAAAIAALVLQSRGGPGSVTPAAMRTLLQKNAFPHDLDPSSASGSAVANDGGGVVITIDSDNDANALTGDNDVNSIQVTYLGPGSLATLVFNPGGTAATAGNVSGGNNGVQDALPNVTYFENSYPGLVFLPATRNFALGTLTGLTPADITAPLNAAPFTGFSNLAPAPANGTSQFFTMSLAFPTANFTDGKVLRFTVGRGAAHSASLSGTVPGPGPTGGTITRNPLADLFGGGIILPSGQRISDGMSFSGTTTGGGTFTGTIKNKIGHGYSKVDGYGFIDAVSAVDRIFGTDHE